MRWLAAVFLLGCSAASTSENETEQEPTRELTIKDSVVAITTPNGLDTWVCSAEVIGARTILSAGHCFEGGNADKTGWKFQVAIGPNAKEPDLIVPISSYKLHPTADLAVATTKFDLHAPKMTYATKPPAADTVVRWAGYGHKVELKKGSQHYFDGRIEAVEPDVIRISSPNNPCHGDSGGPLLGRVDGKEIILGVGYVAYGDCDEGADYMRTDPVADFIDENTR